MTPDREQALDRLEAEDRAMAEADMAMCAECEEDYPAEAADYLSYLCPNCRRIHLSHRD